LDLRVVPDTEPVTPRRGAAQHDEVAAGEPRELLVRSRRIAVEAYGGHPALVAADEKALLSFFRLWHTDHTPDVALRASDGARYHDRCVRKLEIRAKTQLIRELHEMPRRIPGVLRPAAPALPSQPAPVLQAQALTDTQSANTDEEAN